jgi:hypothetical protein
MDLLDVNDMSASFPKGLAHEARRDRDPGPQPVGCVS